MVTRATTFSDTDQVLEAPQPSHCMPMNWSSWSERAIALEMQSPWSEALLSGRKTIETRAYNIPQGLLGRKIYILQSPPGMDGVSLLPDNFLIQESCCQLAGWCEISHTKIYTSKQAFEDDTAAHLVSPGSGYAWNDGVTEIVYGWVVSRAGRTDERKLSYTTASRIYRSLFQLGTKNDFETES